MIRLRDLYLLFNFTDSMQYLGDITRLCVDLECINTILFIHGTLRLKIHTHTLIKSSVDKTGEKAC